MTGSLPGVPPATADGSDPTVAERLEDLRRLYVSVSGRLYLLEQELSDVQRRLRQVEEPRVPSPNAQRHPDVQTIPPGEHAIRQKGGNRVL